MFSSKDKKFEKEFENFMKRGSPINGSFFKTEDKITLEQQETDRVIRRERTLIRTKYQIDIDDIWSKNEKSSKFKCAGPERAFKMKTNSELKKKDVERDASAKRKLQRGQQKIKENSSDSSLTWHQQLSKSKSSMQDRSKQRPVLSSYQKCPGTIPKKNSKGSIRHKSPKKTAKNQQDIENQFQYETKNIENYDNVKDGREINSRIKNVTNDHEQHPMEFKTKENRSLSTQTSPIYSCYCNETEKKKEINVAASNEKNASKCLSQKSPRSRNLPCSCGLNTFNSLQKAKTCRDADRSGMLDSPTALGVTTEIHDRNLNERKLLTPLRTIPLIYKHHGISEERISGSITKHKTSSHENLTESSRSSAKEEPQQFHAVYSDLKSYIEQKPMFSKKFQIGRNNFDCELEKWIKTQRSNSWRNDESEAVMTKPLNFKYREKKYQGNSLCDSQPELMWKQASTVEDSRNSSSSSSNRKSIALKRHSFEKQKETFQKEVHDIDKIHKKENVKKPELMWKQASTVEDSRNSSSSSSNRKSIALKRHSFEKQKETFQKEVHDIDKIHKKENLISKRTASEASVSRSDYPLNKGEKSDSFPPKALMQTEDYIPNDLMAKCKNDDIVESYRSQKVNGISTTNDHRKITVDRKPVQAVGTVKNFITTESKNVQPLQRDDANLRIGPLADYNGCPCMLEKYTQLLSFLDYDSDCL